jgi:flavin reductase ActVB
MASFPSGVAVVTTLDEDGRPRGLTTTAVASVSAHPPQLLVCVDLASRTLPALRARRRFVVNFLREGRSDVAMRFASKADDKFERLEWGPNESGLPVLTEAALGWAECETVQELEAGDHVVLFGRVEAGAAQSGEDTPLMYYRRSWGVWAPVVEDEPEPVPAREVSARDLRWQGAEL